MHLKSITLAGFKSFPDRTRLDFGPGVSVVVGPNGSGKSNVTDAVLWAMGEQSPLAVRGQSMQDVIFGGGHGLQARRTAEVEIVLDNGDQTVDVPLTEISILRRLDRSGEGEYRLNGARCRLVDVIEVLSDTGLGKEMHSVISQGRVESIVTSKPRDRRLLIEEAAGLGKHRKRRRRAQLKLARTQENLDRALDVEREARLRLRPLKRQAEAAELHARLERQVLETRWELGRDRLRARRAELGAAETVAREARAERDRIEQRLQEVIARREQAEQALSQRGEARDAVARRAYAARSAHERLTLRAEQVQATTDGLGRRAESCAAECKTLGETATPAEGLEAAEAEATDRIGALEGELAELQRRRQEELDRELAELERAREQAAARVAELEGQVGAQREARSESDRQAARARERLSEAERRMQETRRQAARVGAELAAVNQFLRSHADSPGGAPTLSQQLEVAPGYELALAAALGGRLGAALVDHRDAAGELLDRSGPDGGSALVSSLQGGVSPTDPAGAPPVTGAQRLLDLVTGPGPAMALARRLLADAWVLDRLEDLPPDFRGIAATRAGRVWFSLPGHGGGGELRQLAEGGAERVLAQRNQRERLVAETEEAAQAEIAARSDADAAEAAVRDAQAACDEADRALREVDRSRAEAAEVQRRSAWLIEQRRSAPGEGALAIRRAELEGELAAERRQADRARREREQRVRRVAHLRAQRESDLALLESARRLAAVLELARNVVAGQQAAVEAELAADRAAGEDLAARLRACAGQESEIQATLRSQGESVTGAEVAAQRLRDQEDEAKLELDGLAERLGLEAEPATEALAEERVTALSDQLERLARRREQLGPVNPLAQDEYAEAVEHVEELETRRTDLETALRELRALIRDTDRQIRETFEQTFQATADNFERLAEEVFPGGRGRLRLVREDSGPRPVLGGQEAGSEGDADANLEAAADAIAEDEDGFGPEEEDLLGVEIEVTPAGKSTKRLSLLSGGEKSMTALAFLFAVFLARPCPFYILDEVEAALDDLNLDRFLALLRRHCDEAQFIVITHQKRTMEAADWLYGVSMGGDGASKVVSRRLPPAAEGLEAAAAAG